MLAETHCTVPEELDEVAPGIFYGQTQPIVAGPEIVAFLKDSARCLPLRRARLCTHPGPEADQHDMVIVSHRDTYVAPHRHPGKSETLLVLEGWARVVIFDDEGNPKNVFTVAPLGGGPAFFYRMPPAVFHSLIIESEYLVFVESTKGPFAPDASETASWAPGAEDAETGRAFLSDILRRAERKSLR